MMVNDWYGKTSMRLSHKKNGDPIRKRKRSKDNVYTSNYVESLQNLVIKSLFSLYPPFSGPWRSPNVLAIREFWDIEGKDSHINKYYFRNLVFLNLESLRQAHTLIDISRGVFKKSELNPYLKSILEEKDKILEEW